MIDHRSYTHNFSGCEIKLPEVSYCRSFSNFITLADNGLKKIQAPSNHGKPSLKLAIDRFHRTSSNFKIENQRATSSTYSILLAYKWRYIDMLTTIGLLFH